MKLFIFLPLLVILCPTIVFSQSAELEIEIKRLEKNAEFIKSRKSNLFNFNEKHLYATTLKAISKNLSKRKRKLSPTQLNQLRNFNNYTDELIKNNNKLNANQRLKLNREMCRAEEIGRKDCKEIDLIISIEGTSTNLKELDVSLYSFKDCYVEMELWDSVFRAEVCPGTYCVIVKNKSGEIKACSKVLVDGECRFGLLSFCLLGRKKEEKKFIKITDSCNECKNYLD